MFFRFILSLSAISDLRLEFRVLISVCPDVVLSLCLVLFTLFTFSNVLFVCDWFFSCSFCVSVLLLRNFVLFSVRFDWSANSGLYFKFISARSVSMLITYSSLYFFRRGSANRISAEIISEFQVATSNMLY